MTTRPFNTLLIGVGNPFRSDDGVAGAVIRRIHGEHPAAVQLLEETGDGAELLDAWKGANTVILIDAVQSGAPSATLYRFDAHAEKLPVWFSHCSTHAFGVAEAIELGRTLGELPPQLIVYAIEGLNFSPGIELSPEIAEVVPHVAARILDELRQLTPVAGARTL